MFHPKGPIYEAGDYVFKTPQYFWIGSFFVLSKKVNMYYFNPLEANHTELVKSHHCKEVKDNKKISDERRNSANALTGKGILKYHWLINFSLLNCERIFHYPVNLCS